MGLATLDKDNRDPLREDHRRRGSARLAHRRRPPRRDRPPRTPRRPGGGERGSASGRSASRRRDQRDAPFGGYPRGVLHQALGVRSELGEIRNAMTLTTITAMQRKNSTWPPQRGARAVARSHSKIAYHRGSLVDPKPRRHRLGALVKTANLRQPEAELPGVQTVQTCNAAGNSDIAPINRSRSGTWRSERSGAVAWLLGGTPIRFVM
jgi:hypothetical protein